MLATDLLSFIDFDILDLNHSVSAFLSIFYHNRLFGWLDAVFFAINFYLFCAKSLATKIKIFQLSSKNAVFCQ